MPHVRAVRTAGLAASLALFATVATAQGTSSTWTGANSSAWLDAGNWTAGVPDANLDAVIAPAANAPSTSGAPGAACHSLTVQAGALLTIAAGFDLAVLADVNFAGASAGAGSLELAGAGVAQGTVPTTRVAGNYTVRSLTVQGSLLQTAGTLTFDGAAAANLRVLGSATFAGTTLTGSGAPTVLDVDGDLTFATTSLVQQAANHPTTIRCAGNWTSNGNFRPAAGTVVFDGTAPQTVATAHPSGTCRWFHLTTAAGSSVVLPAALPLAVDGDLLANGSFAASCPSVVVAGNCTIPTGVTVTLAAATQLHVGSALTIDGTLLAPAAQILGDGPFTLGSAANATFGAGRTHRFLASVTCNGALAAGAGSTFLLQGSGSIASGAGAAALPTTVMATSRVVHSCTIAGDFTQSGGTLTLDGGNGGLLHVLGAATFSGTGIAGLGTSTTIDVDSDLTLQTTAPLTLAQNHPTVIRCGGDWNSNANFQPAAGLVRFDGTAPQTVVTNHPSGACEWFDLAIAAGAVVALPAMPLHVAGRFTLSAPLVANTTAIDLDGDFTLGGGITWAAPAAATMRLGGALTIDGVLDIPAAQLTCNGSFQLGAGATANLGAGRTHRFHQGVTSLGTLQAGAGSDFELLGTGVLISGAGAAAMPTTRIAGSYTAGSCTVNGDLTQTAGTLLLAGATLRVLGNAVFGGTTVGGSGAATTLDIDGSVTFATTGLVDQADNHPTVIRCGGDWNSNANYQPAAGQVVFTGAQGPQAIHTTDPSGNIAWSALLITTAATVTPPAGQPLRTLADFTLQGTLTTSAPAIIVGGNLIVAAGATLAAAQATSVQVAGTATIQGNLTAPSAGLQIGLDLTLAAGSTTTIGNTAHVVGRALASQGTLTTGPNAQIQLLGPGTLAGSGGGSALPRLVLGGDYTTTGATVLDLIQNGGTLTIDGSAAPATLLVLRDASFFGVTVTGIGSSTLDVDRNLRLQTTGLVTQANGPGTIRCGGDWNSDASYQPIAGAVEFDGTAPQQVNAVALTLPSTFIRSDNVTFTLQTLNVLRDLTVEAAFTTPTTALTVQNDLIVTATGDIDVQGGTHLVKHSITVANGGQTRGSGEIIVDGTISGSSFTTVGSGSIGNLRVRNGTVTGNNSTLTGTLTVESGDLVVTGAIQAGADAEMSGGRISGSGTLEIQGTTTLSGTVAGATMPNIIAHGDWVADASFQPTTGSVVFRPILVPIAIRPRGPGTRVVLNDIEIQGGNVRGDGELDLQARTITISAGGVFLVDDLKTRNPAGGTMAVDVAASGELAMGPGARWEIAARTLISVEASGRLSLQGTPGDPCFLFTDGAGPWSLQVAGALDAHDFDMYFGAFTAASSTGLRLLSSIVANNVTIRDGTLRGDGSLTGSAAILRIENSPSLDFHDLQFRNAGNVPFVNVATTALAPRRYRFLNWDGDLGGPAFELDPNNVIDWLGRGRTELASLSAQSGVGRVTLLLTTSREVNTAALRIERAPSPSGPFVPVQSIAPLQGSESQGADYLHIDAGLAPLQRVHYRILDDVPGSPLRMLGEVSAVPWPNQIGSTRFVGPGGFPDIGAALSASSPGDRVLVAAGTYPAFTLTSAVSVLAYGPGLVTIDTTSAPVRIDGVPAGSPTVVIAGLALGGPTAGHGLVLVNCQAPIVLDGLVVEVDAATTTAVEIDSCTQVALQQLVARGLAGLDLGTASIAYLDRGDLTSIRCAADSQLTLAGVTVATPTTDPTITTLPGLPLRVDAPTALSAMTPYVATIAGTPGELWFLLTGSPAFVDPSSILPTGLALLVDPGSMQILAEGGIGAAGQSALQFVLGEDPQTWGLPVHIQVAGLDLARSPLILLGNLRTCYLVP